MKLIVNEQIKCQPRNKDYEDRQQLFATVSLFKVACVVYCMLNTLEESSFSCQSIMKIYVDSVQEDNKHQRHAVVLNYDYVG